MFTILSSSFDIQLKLYNDGTKNYDRGSENHMKDLYLCYFNKFGSEKLHERYICVILFIYLFFCEWCGSENYMKNICGLFKKKIFGGVGLVMREVFFLELGTNLTKKNLIS